MSISTVADVLSLLGRYPLLEPGQLEEVSRALAAQHSEPRNLCRELLQRGWLTPYQVNQLLQDPPGLLALGSYLLLEKISESAMGDVFKARHQRMRRIVALQLIRADLLKTPGAVERFYEEVQAASALSHPNVVASYDAGPVGATHFFAMEYVDGIDLDRLVQQSGPLPINQAVDAIRQTALGLEHAYQRRLRHHDLKPANLLVCSKPAGETGYQVKIRNLGLTIIRQPTKHTRLGDKDRVSTALATADYLAPERAGSGDAGDIRAELYSLGCCLYYLLAGQVPFPGGTVADKQRAHLEQEPAPLESLRGDVPPAVAELCRRLMAKNPADRLASPAAVVAAVAALPASADADTTPDTAIHHWKRRRAVEQQRFRRWVVVSSLALVLGLALFVGLLIRQSQPPPRTLAAATAPEMPVLSREPALVVQCGRSKAGTQTEVLTPGYGYQVHRGDPHDSWGPPVPRSHCWLSGERIDFVVRTPPGTSGVLRLLFASDVLNRRLKILVQGKPFGDVLEGFGGAYARQVDVPIHAADVRDGRIEVAILNVPPSPNAAISTVEFFPYVLPGASVPAPPPLVLQCGKGRGAETEESIARGYGYRLLEGGNFADWPASAGRTHCWAHDRLHFELRVPPGTPGTLRLFFTDPEGIRKQRLYVQGKERMKFDTLSRTGQWFEVPLTAEETREGRIDVGLVKLEGFNAVVSTVEFRPAPR